MRKKPFLKKTIMMLIVFVLIYCFNFFIPRLMPGDPLEKTENEMGAGLTAQQLAEQRTYYGLDQPLMEQFVSTVKRNLTGDFGQSIYYKKSVSEVVLSRLPWTLLIMGSSLIISVILGVFLAMVTRRKRLDGFVYSVMSLLSEIPAFLIGALLLFLVAAKVPWIPLSGNVTAFQQHANGFQWVWDVFLHSLMPVSAMVLITTPNFYFTARSSFLAIGKKKYLMHARAKGLSRLRIQVSYVLLNTIFPIIACFFMSVGTTIGGTLLVENVFLYPGLGTVLRNAVMYSDYMLIQGVFLLSTVIVMGSSWISDFINAWIGKEEAV